ncbi:hypothetical protein, partial [Aeromonas lacus]|uniref:hypothetical protein n=1 Tax=Aeromonas lacus TaxID=558884 RepID=UPI001EE73298
QLSYIANLASGESLPRHRAGRIMRIWLWGVNHFFARKTQFECVWPVIGLCCAKAQQSAFFYVISCFGVTAKDKNAGS